MSGVPVSGGALVPLGNDRVRPAPSGPAGPLNAGGGPRMNPVSGAPVSGASMPGLVRPGQQQPPLGAGTMHGEVEPARPQRQGYQPRRLRPFQRLRAGMHGVSRGALQQIEVPGTSSGLLLGRDGNKAPVLVRMFRDEPTRLSLIGGLWGARVTVFRALAMGARVVVFTNQPSEWQGFGRWATGRDDRVAVMSGERAVTVGATATSPALMLYDVGPHGAQQPPALGPWQTQLTVLRQLTAYGFPSVQASNMIFLQRLASGEASAAASVLQLTSETVNLLQVMRDDMMAVLGGQADRYLWLNPTDVESRQFGAAHR
ncbi:hypothetical protein AB0I55_30860 [Actinocatenispora sera]|uniref:hypothetical protein n=1 Tax=Actinocatenispora sera TaxID=390989 RepID=UPI0033FE9144